MAKRLSLSRLGLALLAGLLLLFASVDHGQPPQAAWLLEAPFSLALLTAHFTHLGWAHALPNLVALLLLYWAAEQQAAAGRFLLALLCSLLAVDLGLLLQAWPLAWYCGLSGALHGGFAWLCLLLLSRPGWARRWAALLWLGGWLKIALELWQPENTWSASSFPLAAPAHVYGYLGGSLLFGCGWLRSVWLQRPAA